jgi:hypothetical protein
VRAAFAYLIAGMALGAWMLILQARRGYGLAHPWPVIHAHLLMVGFLLLLIFGVAFWMFPRVNGARSRAGVAWVGFALINVGLIARAIAEPQADAGTGPVAWRVALGVAAALPVLGALAFGIALWPRVRAAMSPEEARRLRRSRNEAQAGG